MTDPRQPMFSQDPAPHVLFASDRTCCVCRTPAKAVQIHHIDGNRDNNEPNNLAVLCLDCHNATQIQGGFTRKLDSDQIILYRDDWQRIVSHRRAIISADTTLRSGTIDRDRLQAFTSIAEIYRDNGEFELLAMHYHSMGNYELRDKYVELAVKNDPSDQTICHLRALQGKIELVPSDVIERRLRLYTTGQDWCQRARFYDDFGKPIEAVMDYLRGIQRSLDENRLFGAAFYLKELARSGLIDKLFSLAYEQAKSEDSLWWMIRALQELDRQDEVRSLVLDRAEEIERSENLQLLLLLAMARGDKTRALELLKEIARGTHVVTPTPRRETP